MKFSFLLLFAISSTAFARGPAGTFRDFYGPEFHPQPSPSSNKNPKAASDVCIAGTRSLSTLPVWITPRCPRRTSHVWRTTRPRPCQPRHGDCSYCDLRRNQRDFGGISELHRNRFGPASRFDLSQPWHRRRMTLLFPFIRRKRPPLTRNWRTTFCASTATSRKAMG